jgi:branched-chain amino acid transport system permease protein
VAVADLLQYLVSGLVVGAIYALVGLGYTGIYNVTRIVNFAQGDFAMLGAMLAIWFLETGLPLLPAAVVATVVVAAAGGLLHLLAIRPARADEVTGIIITLGAGVFFQGLVLWLWGSDARAMPAFSGEAPLLLLGAAVVPQAVWVLGASGALMFLLHLFFARTYLGKAFRACAVNRTGATLMGIEVDQMGLLSFVLSGLVGAVAGIIVAPIVLARYDLGTMIGIKGFVACILGGMGHSIGAVVGGFVLGILESGAAGLVSSGFKNAIAFLVMLLVLFVRPGGIFGEFERTES